MSKRSGRQTPRQKRGIVIFLLLFGGFLFVASVSLITYSQTAGKGSPLAFQLEDLKTRVLEKVNGWNQGKEGKLLLAETEMKLLDSLVEVKGESDSKEQDNENADIEVEVSKEVKVEDQLFEAFLQDEQNDVTIKILQFEMKDEFLIVRFEISNGSDGTLYFPYHGTYASFYENGGTMYRDNGRDNGIGYDQITSVIDSGETVVGKIAYSPLLYRDKPFTIYINGVKFREKEAGWRSFEYYFDPTESL